MLGSVGCANSLTLSFVKDIPRLLTLSFVKGIPRLLTLSFVKDIPRLLTEPIDEPLAPELASCDIIALLPKNVWSMGGSIEFPTMLDIAFIGSCIELEPEA